MPAKTTAVPPPRSGPPEPQLPSAPPQPPPHRPPRYIPPHERAHHAEIERYKAGARELTLIAQTVRDVSENVTALLAQASLGSPLDELPTGHTRSLALARALTREDGLGFAFSGGRLGRVGSSLADLLGKRSLATDVMVLSLRLRLAALESAHPEMTGDPKLAHFIEAVHEHRELEIMRALRTLFHDEGAVHAFSSLAPMFAEILSLKALLDRNPFNDTTAWGMATGTAAPTAEPFFGLTVKLMTSRDKGDGAARPIDQAPYEAELFTRKGSLLGYLRAIAVLGNDGRIAIQTVRGPDGVERHVVLVPGMRPAWRGRGSPASLVGAFRSALEDVSPYTGAVRSAIGQYGLPDGAELALIGHSAGGPAAMNLAQEAEFCRRFTVTDVITLGSPVDRKRSADPATFVASITNQHDIVPTLEGVDAGRCFDPHPDWYVVDYTEPTHQFPECHGVEHYLRDLENLLTEPRAYLEERLRPYAGDIVRTQLYQTYAREPKPPGYPFLTVPTRSVTVGPATVELPLRCARGDGLVAFYQVDRDVAVGLAKDGSRTEPLGFAGRALVAVIAGEAHEGGLGRHRFFALGVVVDGPWRSGRMPWADLLRRADQRGAGIRLLSLAVSGEEAAEAYRELWGLPARNADVRLSLGPLRARAEIDDDGTRVGFGGLLGPGMPSAARDVVLFSRSRRSTLRSQLDIRGLSMLHVGAGTRLAVSGPGVGMAAQARELGLDRTRPLLCLTARGLRARIDAGAPLPGE